MQRDADGPTPDVLRQLERILDDTAESIWTRARNPRTGHVGVDWAGPAPEAGTTVSLPQMSAAAMALQLHAMPVGQAAGRGGRGARSR